MATISLAGLHRIKARLNGLVRLDLDMILEEWARILGEDNERRALAGLDHRDQPMVTTKRELNPAMARRLGSGPPLCPNGRASRIIRLAQTRYRTEGPRSGRSELYWDSFDSRRGRAILPMHAAGSGRLPRRDVLSKPSPTAIRLAREALRVWARHVVRGLPQRP